MLFFAKCPSLTVSSFSPRVKNVVSLSFSLSVRCMSLYRPVLQFFRALVQPEYSAVTDVYVLMFLADTVDFIIIVFGFWAFGVKYAASHDSLH